MITIKLNIFRKITLVLFLIICCTCVSTYGQSYESLITEVTDFNGDSPGGTYSIAEDSDGFIWFGTVEGLYRYDGYNLKKFRHNQNDLKSLSSNTIRTLCLDGEKLWIGTPLGGGLNCLDIQTERITNYIHTDISGNEISGNSIWSLLTDKKGNLWIGHTENGVDLFDKETKQFKNFDIFKDHKETKFKTTVKALFEDDEGIIWAGIGNYGLVAIDTKANTLKSFKHDQKNKNGLNNNTILDITDDKKGNILIATYGGGINVYNKLTNSFSYIKNDPNNKNSLISDLTYGITKSINGKYWIATEYGISVFDPLKNSFKNYKKDICIPNSLSDNRIRTIFIDSNNVIWIGTESGVNKIIQQNNFLLHTNVQDNPKSLPEGIVRAISEDQDQNLWIGFINHSLIFYNNTTQTYKAYTDFYSKTHKNKKEDITTILQDSNNDIWLGEWNSGLFKLNKTSGIFEHIASTNSGENSLSDTRIQKILEDKPGYLWIGTESGINYFDINNNKCYHLLHDPSNSNSLSGNAIQSNAMVIDNEGNLWVGIWSGGLNKISFSDSLPLNATYKSWKNNPENIKSLSNNNVISLHFDKHNNLWIGYDGGGLSKFDPKAETFSHYSTSDGLPSNKIFSIIEDKNGFLWLSTAGGLSKFDPKKEMFNNYYQTDGLQSNQFFWGSSHKGKSGNFYFGGINGFNSFYPDSIYGNIKDFPIVLVSLKIFDNEYSEKSLSKLTEIELKHNENFLTFEFAALNYFDSRRIRYQYKMEGIDENWNNNGERRFANYTNIAPGNYIFRVKTVKSVNDNNSKELILKVTIHPPWWATWWARSILFTAIVGGILSFYFIRIHILKNQKKRLEEIVKQRTYEINESKNDLKNKNSELLETLKKLEITQNALIESEKMASIGIMSAGIAHEINNPLNFIGLSQQNIQAQINDIIKENKNISKEQSELLKKLFSHTNTGIIRISNIIKSLKIHAHKSEEKKIIKEASVIIDSVLTILDSKIPDNIEIIKEYSPGPKVLCIPDHISQVLLNLTENAIDAIEEQSTDKKEQIIINTSVERKNGTDYVLISILNTGTHINENDLKHIFDPFFTTKSPNKGSGLGLYISYNIINEHKGTLKVENTFNGVKFLVYLPVNKD